MGHRQLSFVNFLRDEANDVQIQRPRGPSLGANASGIALDLLERGQKGARFERGLQRSHLIEIRLL